MLDEDKEHEKQRKLMIEMAAVFSSELGTAELSYADTLTVLASVFTQLTQAEAKKRRQNRRIAFLNASTAFCARVDYMEQHLPPA